VQCSLKTAHSPIAIAHQAHILGDSQATAIEGPQFEFMVKDFAFQQQRLQIPRAGGAEEQIAVQIQIMEKILDWNRRCKPCIEGQIGKQGVEGIEKEIKDLKKRLGEMRKNAKSSGS
jgi:hypothetical protein